MKYTYDLNTDAKLRDEIIFGKYNEDNYSNLGEIKHFSKLSLDKLKKLIELNFILLDECQNDSPTTEEILNFMKNYPEYYAHGYTVGLQREDYRITLEGVAKDSDFDTDSEKADFLQLFRFADELAYDGQSVYCWYD